MTAGTPTIRIDVGSSSTAIRGVMVPSLRERKYRGLGESTMVSRHGDDLEAKDGEDTSLAEEPIVAAGWCLTELGVFD